MADSFFDSMGLMPNADMVAEILANAYPLWDELYNYVLDNYPKISGEWKYYSNTSGWIFKLISKKRNLFFFIPKSGYFKLNFIFGGKAAACIEIAELPEEIKEAVRTAKVYLSSRGVDLDVNNYNQLNVAKLLLKIKFEN